VGTCKTEKKVFANVNVNANVDANANVNANVRQWALTGKQTLLGGGALERDHGAPLESLAQLGDALGVVGPLAMIVEDAEMVAGQTAMGKEECQWALTKKGNTLGRRRTSAP
jgi:hypothetical protein